MTHRLDDSAAAAQEPLTPAAPPVPFAAVAVPPPAVHPPHYHGHRQRLRQRFLNGGRAALADYELLELVLATAIPRGDVKPLAKALLARFGRLADVFRASPQELAVVKGIGETTAAMLKVIEAAALVLLEQDLQDRPVLRNWQTVVDYCRAQMGHSRVEQFRLLFLDARNAVIRDEVQQTGTINQTAIYPREVVKRALEVGASAVIMVHNHPSGDPTPSRADIDMTRHVATALKAVGIELHDHLIISRGDHVSLKAMGFV
jgi:DNA repair protein RadC